MSSSDKIVQLVFSHNEKDYLAAVRLHRYSDIDPKLKLSDGEREGHEYVPKSLEPPDWR